MAIVVQPKTQAELNQLTSVLDSKGKHLDWSGGIGKYYNIWESFKEVHPHDTNLFPEYGLTPVNELYAKLN